MILRISSLPGEDPSYGVATLDKSFFPCRLGSGGVSRDKKEGDGCTPQGRFSLLNVLYRPDRSRPPPTSVFCRPLYPHEAWCSDPRDPAYNWSVTLPYPSQAEPLWQESDIFDLVAVVGYNMHPAIPGRGSGIFLRLADGEPTEGSIGLSRIHLDLVLENCTGIEILPPPSKSISK